MLKVCLPILSPQLCYGFICPPFQYRPKEDVFNAAQSGAMVLDLISPELKYLLEQLKKVGHAACVGRGFRARAELGVAGGLEWGLDWPKVGGSGASIMFYSPFHSTRKLT